MASTQLLEPGYDYSTSEKRTIPASSAKTGTVAVSSGSKVVTGTATAFESEFQKGDYIYIENSHQLRKVSAVYSDTRLDVEVAYGTTDSGRTPERVRITETGYKEVSLSSTGSADAVISTIDKDNKTFPQGLSINYVSDNNIGPIAIVTTTASSAVTITIKR